MARIGDRQKNGCSKPPTGRFTSFTPLTALIDQFLMHIKDKGTLTFPGKLKGDPNKRPRDKYYRFHHDHGHDTSDYYNLKKQIEALIRQGNYKGSLAKRGWTHHRSKLPGMKRSILGPPRRHKDDRRRNHNY